MAAPPFMRLFISAYFEDTAHLSCQQHGIYLQLIMRYFTRGGPLPDDDAHLAALVRLGPREWAKHRPVIAAYFQVGGGKWVHPRVDEEIEYVEAKSLKAQEAGKASAQRRSSKRRTKAQPRKIEKEEGSPSGEPTPIPFAAPQPEWSHFAEFRTKIGKPLTEHAVNLALAKLAKLETEGHDPKQVINQSIMNGWAGLFEIKDQSNGKRPHPADRESNWLKALNAERNSKRAAE